MKLLTAQRPTAALAIAAAAAAIAAPLALAAPAAAAGSVTTARPVTVGRTLNIHNGNSDTASTRPGTGTVLEGTGFSRLGTPATFTALLYPATPVAGEPPATGTLSFFDGARLLGDALVGPDGTATFTTTALAAGLHSITASYNGDANYAGSTSDPLTQEVVAATLFTSPAALSGVVGSPLSFVVRTTGFPPPLLKASGNLDGLNLTDHGDGTATLGGTPVAPGVFPITVSAGSLVNSVTTQVLTLTVTLNRLVVTTSTLPSSFVGHSYRVNLLAGQGTGPYVWTLAGGWLPPGLWLRPDGTVAGTPRHNGRWTFAIRVTDSSHPRAQATQVLTLTVAGR